MIVTSANATEDKYYIEPYNGTHYRIRKLTPKECGRIMDVSDDDIDKILEVNSNTQAYKQFGNSIVVQVMVAMFSNLHIQGIPEWEKIKKNIE